MKLQLVAAVVWIATVTATSESDSRGNWSNEKAASEHRYEKSLGTATKEESKKIVEGHYILSVKHNEGARNSSQPNNPDEAKEPVKFIPTNEDNYGTNETYNDSRQRYFQQVIQPYLIPGEEKRTQESTSNEPNTVLISTRTSQNASNNVVTVEYLPSQEITFQNSTTTNKFSTVNENNSNELNYSIPEEQINAEPVGDFGQRVRSLPSRQRNNFGRIKFRQPIDNVSSPEEYRKQSRKYFRPLGTKKLNITENTVKVSIEDRVPFSSIISGESQKILKQKDTEEVRVNSDVQKNNKMASVSLPWSSGEIVNREQKLKKNNLELSNIAIGKDTFSSTSSPAITVSLGKFSGPIVVPDLPRQKKYSSTTPDSLGSNEVSKPTSLPEPTKTKGLDTGYLAMSPIILNPLQVGVALMNAKQDLHSLSDPNTVTKDYVQDETQPPKVAVSNDDGVIQNDSTGLGNSNVQNDQLTEQEQISETVASNSRGHSVEIQKSVEIYHTAPVQEIHYPMEFVLNTEQPLVKQNDYRKLQKGHFKERRPGQINVYKSNEITDEINPSNSQERGRYEYNINENDVVYSATNGQLDQAVLHSDNKPVFGAREQVNNVQYTRIQGNSEALPKEPLSVTKGQTVVVTQQPSRVIENLSSLVNLESPQGTQEVPQILLNKPANDPQTELRFVMTAPQPHTVEKVIEKTVHVPHPIDVLEKKILYPVEKVIEKQITIPQPFPVHVPIDRIVEKQIRIPYPVHVEKVIEKKVPYAIQRLIIPFPIHFRVPQPVPIPVEKVVEKPVPVPVAVEKIVEKSVHAPRPYPLETTKFVKSIAIPVYNVQNDGNYQQVVRQQSFQTLPNPSYGSISDDQSYYNSTQIYGLGYATLNRPLARQPAVHTLPKKFVSHGAQYPHSVSYVGGNGGGNSVFYGRVTVEKDNNKVLDEYVGPVPRKVPIGIQSKSIQYTSPEIQATMRRARQDGVVGNSGNFRQSKMEYGFKPPMVPSVQYDEQTATKVE